MMRTVNKDDCLVGRGANPRTGLITPDWNSVTSSLDNDHAHSARRDRPSAQWKLDGDAWVSVPPQEQLADGPIMEHPRAEDSVSRFDHADSPLSSKKASRKWPAAALTEKNLRTFSNQSQLDQPTDKAVPHNREPAEEIKIKRKPVGSPSAKPTSATPTKEAVRSFSHDTVVHSPEAEPDFAKKRQWNPEYYSPDSIGVGLSRSDALNFPQRARNGSPFLGVPVEPPDNTASQLRGFTSKATNGNQLQRSLRMSSGPYPSHPLSQHAMLGQVDCLLYTSQTQHEGHKKRLNRLKGPSVPHQPALRAYCPDDVTSSRLAEPRFRLQNLPRYEPQSGRKLPHHEWKPVLDSQGDQRLPDLSDDSNTQQMLNTTYTTTNTHIPTSGRRIARDMLPHHHEYASSARDIFLDRNRTAINGIEKCPEPAGYHTNKDVPLESRPQLRPREQGMLRIPKIRIEPTDMVHRSHSNTIGTATIQPGEGGEVTTTEGLTENSKTPRSTVSVSLSEVMSASGDQLVLYDADRAGTPETYGQECITSSDHTACCPECCVKFDCHGGCLGHPSPNVSIAGSETSSLVSMGVFDSSFETSVKAINKVLLTPREKGSGRLTKVRTIFGWKPGTTSLTETSPRPKNTMKRTLRVESLSQKVNAGLGRPIRPVIKGPRGLDTKQAKTAAIRALDAGESFKENLIHSSKARNKTKNNSSTKKTAKSIVERKAVEAPAEANEGRRISNQAREINRSNVLRPQTLPQSSSETTLVQSGSEDEEGKAAAADGSMTNAHHTVTMSVVDRVSILIRRNSSMVKSKCINLASMTDPVLLVYAQLIGVKSKDMTLTVADTTAVVVAMMLEYNRSGKLSVPAGMSTSELAGNLLRSVLYLMIATCFYALFVKAGRFILAVLRIVLFPVRVCAWIIG